jgi:hypothetical protein
MSRVHPVVPGPVWPPAPGRPDSGTSLNLLSLPVVLDAASCAWPRAVPPPPAMAHQATRSPVEDIVDEWGVQSFPASDPPANW